MIKTLVNPLGLWDIYAIKRCSRDTGALKVIGVLWKALDAAQGAHERKQQCDLKRMNEEKTKREVKQNPSGDSDERCSLLKTF